MTVTESRSLIFNVLSIWKGWYCDAKFVVSRKVTSLMKTFWISGKFMEKLDVWFGGLYPGEFSGFKQQELTVTSEA